MIGKDLQLDRQVDLAHINAAGHLDEGRCEVEDASDSGLHQAVGNLLGSLSRSSDDADGDLPLLHNGCQVIEGGNGQPGDDSADPIRIDIDKRRDPDAARAEALIGRERRPEIADTYDDDVPILGLADLAGDVVAEVFDVVADPTGAVGPKVGQILAQLGRVDTDLGGEVVG